jgi:hypothetical protein
MGFERGDLRQPDWAQGLQPYKGVLAGRLTSQGEEWLGLVGG